MEGPPPPCRVNTGVRPVGREVGIEVKSLRPAGPLKPPVKYRAWSDRLFFALFPLPGPPKRSATDVAARG